MRPLYGGRTLTTLVALALAGCATTSSPASPTSATSAPTGPAISSSPTPTRSPAVLTLGLQFQRDDLYRDNDQGWPLSDAPDASESFDVGHGYVVHLGGTARAIYPGPSFKGVAPEKLSDYAVDVQVEGLTIGPADAVGVFCRYAAPSTEQYSFVLRVAGDGTETYEVWRDDRAPGAQPRKLASDSARPSTPVGTRTMRAVCVGGKSGPADLIFLIGGRQVLRATDDRSPLTTGVAGLVLWRGISSTAGATAKFSFFSVTGAAVAP